MTPREPVHNSTNYTHHHRGEQILDGLRFRFVSTDNSFLLFINAAQGAETIQWRKWRYEVRDELSYLAPLGSESISAPYFNQCFFRGGGVITPQTESNKYFILYIEFCINNNI